MDLSAAEVAIVLCALVGGAVGWFLGHRGAATTPRQEPGGVPSPDVPSPDVPSPDVMVATECRSAAVVSVERGAETGPEEGGLAAFRHRVVEKAAGKELAIARTVWEGGPVE